MKYIKLSDFLKLEIKPFLYGAFLSRIMESNFNSTHYFYCYTSFKKSKFVFENDFDMNSFSNTLIDKYNFFSGHTNWDIHSLKKTSMELRFYILNDLNLTKKTFYKILYGKLNTEAWIYEEDLTSNKKSFIRGFMEPRGSIDTTAKLISQDYFFNDRFELKKSQILTDIMNLPIEFANFNARNLQPQYISGVNKRNSQFRININYYATTIGFINDYKSLIFQKAYKKQNKTIIDNIIYYDIDVPKTKNDEVVFIKYLNFFTNNIYEKELTPSSINDLRKKLGFNKSDKKSNIIRNRTIIELFKEITPDKCAICGTKETFINSKTNRNHYEIHHMISFHNGKEFDNIANLVKLCPTCHDMMRKGITSKEKQIKAITKILNEHPEIFEFTGGYLGIDDINELAIKVQDMLG